MEITASYDSRRGWGGEFKIGQRQATGAAQRDVDDDVGFGGVGREIYI